MSLVFSDSRFNCPIISGIQHSQQPHISRPETSELPVQMVVIIHGSGRHSIWCATVYGESKPNHVRVLSR